MIVTGYDENGNSIVNKVIEISSRPVYEDDFSLEDQAKLDSLPTSSELTTSLNNKVDKVIGKELTTNDFTDSYKTKLEAIDDEANKYVHPSTHSINEVDGLSAILNQKVDKVEGKDLSTNDFTDESKSWLEELPKILWRQRNETFKQRVLSQGSTIIHEDIEEVINLEIFSSVFLTEANEMILKDWQGSQAAFDSLVSLQKGRKYHVMSGNEVTKTYIG